MVIRNPWRILEWFDAWRGSEMNIHTILSVEWDFQALEARALVCRMSGGRGFLQASILFFQTSPN